MSFVLYGTKALYNYTKLYFEQFKTYWATIQVYTYIDTVLSFFCFILYHIKSISSFIPRYVLIFSSVYVVVIPIPLDIKHDRMGITLRFSDIRLLQSREHFSATIENVRIVRGKLLDWSRRMPFLFTV